MVNIRKLEKEYNKLNLTDYLKQVSLKELYEYLGVLFRDDIIGIREKIFEVILIELQYRNQPLYPTYDEVENNNQQFKNIKK